MRKGYYFLFAFSLFAGLAAAQNPFTFTNANSRFSPVTFHSGNSVSVVDMNGDGMDDIARLDQSKDLYYTLQRTGTTFNNIHAVSTGTANAWAMVVGDVNNDGKRDVAVGFGSSAKLVMADSTLSNFTLLNMQNSNFFLQNMNFADIDNDGWVDLFGCNDDGASRMWMNSGTGTYGNTSTYFSTNNYGPAGSTGLDNSGNYGSIWTDVNNDGNIDLYIAHCRQGTSSNNANRLDQLFISDSSHHYVLDSFNTRGLNNYHMTWTASFEDIDNDGDLDCLLTENDVATQLFTNDGTGHFTEITATSGIVVNITPYQSKMEDLDNDGYVDIIITGDDSRVFHNNHDNTFTLVNGLFDNNHMLSFATGDLNHDGKIDIYASYGSVYNNPTNVNDVLWMNTTNNGNHFITFNLQGTASNRDALGARVEIYGPWGKQIREVRSGESYGTTNSFMCHFGLGSATMVDSAIIRWPSHQVTTLYNRPADQFITVIEGQCSSPDNIISFNGAPVLCGGQSLTMNAAPGYSYLWSTGDTTQAITISTEGEYNVRVLDNNTGCGSYSQTLNILTTPDETPTITAASATTLCEGDSLMLQSTPAASYLWSNGDTTQTTTVTQSGTYVVTIQGSCATFASQPVSVNTIASHINSVTPAAVCDGGSVTLQANVTGTSVWFTSDTGSVAVGSGNSYTTPTLNSSATYYVESRDTILGLSGELGPVDNTFGSGGFFSGDQYLIFDANKELILHSVTVYANSSKPRTIQLRSSSGSVLDQYSDSIYSGMQVITLDWDIPADTAYQLGWQSGSSPDLYRNATGAQFPYTLDSLAVITGNSVPDAVHYYAFYNWQIEEKPTTCISSRTPVTATINPLPVVSFNTLSSTYYSNESGIYLVGTPNGGTFSGPGVSNGLFSPSDAGVGGPYTITYSYTDSNGCAGTSAQQVTVLQDTSTTGVSSIGGFNNVSLFPNPSNGQFTLSFNTSTTENIQITVTDITGRKIYDEPAIAVPGTVKKQVALGEVAKGVYNLVLTSGKMRNAYKLVIE